MFKANLNTDFKAKQQDENDALDPLAETALEWLVNLHSGDETEQDWQNYEHWKTANPQQLAASQAAENLWANIGPAINRPSITETATKIASQAFVVFVAFIGLFSLGVQQNILQSPARLMADHRTPKTTGKTMTLADGSTLQIDAATQLDINFSAAERQITLYSGQIHIDVAADNSRPFRVVADNISIRALGTGFNVNYYHEQVSVAVTEHSVQISNTNTSSNLSSNTSSKGHVKVDEGYQLHYSETQGFGEVMPANLSTTLAWQRQKLIFDNQPLSKVVAAIQRYNSSNIIILSEALKQHRVTGVFDMSDSGSMLTAIEDNLPVKVQQYPWFIVLSEE
jgi:transmembrane sensor